MVAQFVWKGEMNNRRKLLVALGASVIAAPFALFAQQSEKVYRIGFLSPRPGIESGEEAFRQGLRKLGYVEGQNIVLEWRFTKGRVAPFPQLASEMVRLRVDCILAVGVSAVEALKQSTKTIPIVMGTIDADPVKEGIIASLARPGGNITGLVGISWELAGKRIELLKQAIPSAIRVAILVDPSPAGLAHVREAEVAARNLGMQLRTLEVRDPEGLANAFQVARQWRAEALSVVGTGLVNSHRAQIVNLAVKTRLPTIYSNADFVLEGGLMSYADDPIDRYRRAAAYVDKILKGTKPADLPVEQPTKFELVINFKTAKQVGLKIPPSVLARADRVID